MNLKNIIVSIGFIGLILLTSCTTTRTVWIPVFSVNGGGVRSRESYDPDKNRIINPSAKSTYAYFRTDKKGDIVFSNEYKLNFSEKVTYTITNDELSIDKLQSTDSTISYLDLHKSFFFSKPENSADTADLYFNNNNIMIIFNNEKLKDGQLIYYDILGESLGTFPVNHVTIIDALPSGLNYHSSEYFFYKNNGSFEHKIVKNGVKSALVLEAKLNKPLSSGDRFIIRIGLTTSEKDLMQIF